MANSQCCRTCMGVRNLNLIFPSPEHCEKYTEVIFSTAGIKVQPDDCLPQTMCTPCINFINESYNFRKKSQENEKLLLERVNHEANKMEIKIKENIIQNDIKSINISDLLTSDEMDFTDYDDNITLSDYNIELKKYVNNDTIPNIEQIKYINKNIEPTKDNKKNNEQIKDNKNNIEQIKDSKNNIEQIKENKNKIEQIKDDKKNMEQIKDNKKNMEQIKDNSKNIEHTNKSIEIYISLPNSDGTNPPKRVIIERKESRRVIIPIQEICKGPEENAQCKICDKVCTSISSLKIHYKIHANRDIICEHCGKQFPSKRLLLRHCKSFHGYEKTDKCSYCEYRGSSAEQVKVHERIHTGEKPYVCSSCGARFHRNCSLRQHIGIHLTEKTVQCDLCPSRFKSSILMRIHRNRHKQAYTYKCGVCDNLFARRRNVKRHLTRIHSLQPDNEHIVRTKKNQV